MKFWTKLGFISFGGPAGQIAIMHQEVVERRPWLGENHFLPCFFFIFTGAPFIEAMAGNQRLQAALTGITAAVVGDVLNLAMWFGVKVIWHDGATDLFAIGAAITALVGLVKCHLPIHWLVPAGALAGILRQLAF